MQLRHPQNVGQRCNFTLKAVYLWLLSISLSSICRILITLSLANPYTFFSPLAIKYLLSLLLFTAHKSNLSLLSPSQQDCTVYEMEEKILEVVSMLYLIP